MRRFRGEVLALCCVGLGLAFGVSAHAAIIHVPADYITIQEGIDAAAAGDTVLVAPGEYTGLGNRDIDFEGKNVVLIATEGPESTVIDCEILGRGFYFASGEDSTCVIDGFTIKNGVGYQGGGIFIATASPSITRCRIEANTALSSSRGGGLYMSGTEGDLARPRISDCVFVGNSADGYGGGAYITWYGEPTFVGCVFESNSAPSGGGVWCWKSAPSFVNCTFYGNTSGVGTGGDIVNPTFKNTIAAFNAPGGGIYGVRATLECCDVYGNEGGDWVGSIADQYGVDGNISEDPLFCDAGSGDLTISTDSPCAPWENPECGLIGAFGVGCEAEVPVITHVTDVGNDQGKQIRIRWLRSLYDAPEQPEVITEYAIYRRQDEFRMVASEESVDASWNSDGPRPTRLDGWECVGIEPAAGDEAYQHVVPTLCDSTELDGICWSVFMIRAMTPDPLVHYASRPDSGYSLDNLDPEPPAVARGEFVPGNGDVTISWSPSESVDLSYYEVFRGEESSLSAEVLLGTAADTMFVDTSLEWTADSYYRIVSVDFAGNRSDEGTVISALETGIPDEGGMVTAVSHSRPNPFNPAAGATQISFTLPAPGGDVNIAVFDLAGRRVRGLVNKSLSAGTHTARWDGTDDRGRRVAAGVYFYRVSAPGIDVQRKLLVLR